MQPVLVLHIDDVQLLKADVVCNQPRIQQALTHKAENTPVICGVAGHIQFLFQLKQDVKQPRAVMLQQLLFHDKHIEMVAMRLGHIHIIRRQILRAFACDDGAGCGQVPLVMGVDILGIVGLNEIVPFLRQYNVGCSQNGAQLLMADDAILFGGKAAFSAAGKIAAVMHNTDIVRIYIVCCPVQAGQLTEIGISLRNILAGVIADIADSRVDGVSHLYRQIHGVIRHPVRFMRCYDNGGLQCVLPALRSFPILSS